MSAEADLSHVVEATVLPKVRTLQWRLNVLASFLIVMLLVIAGLLQRQASDMSAQLDEACHQRQANGRNNAQLWVALAAKTADPVVADAYRVAAHNIVIPTC